MVLKWGQKKGIIQGKRKVLKEIRGKKHVFGNNGVESVYKMNEERNGKSNYNEIFVGRRNLEDCFVLRGILGSHQGS